jgi:putative ABC transport system ATP-binding protein
VASGQTLIKLENVTKIFYTDEVETHALSGIHLDINKGEYVSIAGPSGCGKSTLLSIIGLLDSPTDGSYILNSRAVQGLDFSDRARIRNQEIGFIFQSFNLIGDLTVYENVELPLTYRSMSSAERKKRVQESLEKVGMAHRMRHYPSQLSGGQQQRVAVARALGGSPSILLADEPTGNLDSRNGEAVMELLQQLHREGATICMVTHDARFAITPSEPFTCLTAKWWRKLRPLAKRRWSNPSLCKRSANADCRLLDLSKAPGLVRFP